MNVIFLDFDGVLNCRKYLLTHENQGVAIDPERLALLKRIVDATDAEIVLTTSWREQWKKGDSQIDRIFADLRILDKTPQLPTGRESEIKSWLDDHRSVRNFVVLDDQFLSADYLEGHFVKTSFYGNGLDETGVQKAIEILNR